MDETSTSDTATTTRKPCSSNNNISNNTSNKNNRSSSSSSSVIFSNPGAGNMETKGANIPTNAQQPQGSTINNGSISGETVEATSQPPPPTATSDQSNPTTKTRETSKESSCSSNSTASAAAPPPLPPPETSAKTATAGNGSIKCETKGIACQNDDGEKTGEPDIDGAGQGKSNGDNGKHQSSSNNISSSQSIDPVKESTTTTTTVVSDSAGQRQQDEVRSSQGPTALSSSSSGCSTNNNHCSNNTKEKVLCADNDSHHPNSDSSSKTPVHVNSETSCEVDVDSGKGAGLTSGSNTNGSKPPVPNFRVEGSGAGDSSITVAVAALSSAVSASVTLHSGGGRGGGGSTGGTNSLENGEQPGSSSGPVSMQSSEEMRLSLVSWYSEPDDPSRVIEGCCSALNTYRQEVNGTNGEDIIIAHSHMCDSGSSMGHEAISSVATNSPACKSESEEKENKTPEPCENHDKMSGVVVGDKNGTIDTISRAEFINPYNNASSDKNPSATANSDGVSNKSFSATNQDEQHRHAQVNKSGECEVGDHSNVKKSRDKSASDPSKSVKSSSSTTPQKSRAHVQVTDNKQTCSSSGSGGHIPRCQDNAHRSSKPECPRCSRRSKSGTTTPASGAHVPKTRTPASRRVVQSSKSSTEIKKPIKSILKHDSRGSAGSGSGSDKQSSMDSLGSTGEIGATPAHILRGRMSNTLMTRSDSGARARFNFNIHGPSDTPTGVPEDKAVSKLKRIEKYATLRIRKSLKPRPLDLSDTEGQSNDIGHVVNSGIAGTKVGVPGVPNDIMSKSMSYLEKSSSNRVHISSAQGHSFGESTSASSTLKRQGSLRVKKHSTPQWEPSGTRTSALRLQKMQEAKAKNSPSGGVSSGSANSGSTHSGSGDSLHYLPHSANSTSTSAGSSGMNSIHLTGSHSAPVTHGRMSASVAAKEKHMGAKIFSKLSSALGQTASSNQKRVRQERGVQTDVPSSTAAPVDTGRVSLSPVPALDAGFENVEQIKNLERLCNRYKNQFIKAQSEFEKSESRKVELQKQLEETQHESTEMIEFLQAEKSTLAESLTEVEIEAQKWKDETEALKRDYQSRCSSLVRLSEQHKQEALKSQALLQRLETQSTAVISQLSHQLTDGAQSIHQTTQRVTALTDSLLKTYKVPPELLASSETNQPIKETDLSCSLLLPLITSLSAAFPMVPMPIEMTLKSSSSTGCTVGSTPPTHAAGKRATPTTSEPEVHTVTVKLPQQAPVDKPTTSLMVTESSSFQSLNQAILEREAAEKSGLDDIMKPFGLIEGASPDADQLSLRKEITELNAAIAKLLNVVRVIVIHCDRKVSSVASSILQCLKSIEDDKVGSMAEIAQVQKSLEAWSDKGISAGSSTTTTSSSGSPPCKTTATSTSVCETPPSYLVGNGHAHV